MGRFHELTVPATKVLVLITTLITHAASLQASDANGGTFDYVIVGGGLSGLVVANRLSADPKTSVLVIEHGYIDYSPITSIPYNARLINSADMWNVTSEPQVHLGNITHNVLVGSVVGGGSVVNGMQYNRGTKADYDAWEELGSEGWGWEGLYPYFRKSTTYTPPPPDVAEQFNITWSQEAFGNGPLHISGPKLQYEDIKTIWAAWKSEPIPLPKEGQAGDALGAFWTPSSLDARTATRAHSRTMYYDPVSDRPNLHLLVGQKANQILFSEGLEAKGVQMIARADNSTTKVYAAKEVILAAGAIFTPHLLQISGIGPRSVLDAAGIEVKKDTPAVGANFQDHPTVYMSFNLSNLSFPNPTSISINETYRNLTYQEYITNKTGPWAITGSNSLAFLSLPQITSSYGSIIDTVKSQDALDYLPSIYRNSSAILAGYKAQQDILTRFFSTNVSAVGEYPITSTGGAAASLQKPLSRGTITLNTTHPYAYPIVQYNALSNPVDTAVVLAMIRYNRAFWSKPELSVFSPVEVAPGAQYQSDEEIMTAIVKQAIIKPSFAHPSGSCALMPEELGGCVGSDLKVYGVKGLRIVDASIIPIIPGAHLQATMYAVAEKAADLILGRG